MWPGITPFTVWDLPWRQWVMFAEAADEWAKQRQGQRDG